MKKLIFPILLLVCSLLSSCVTSKPTFLDEKRVVTETSSETLSIKLNQKLIYKDSDFDPLVGVQLAPGRYVLEAEDDEFWYFRSPVDLQILLFSFGNIDNKSDQPGGVFISKTGANPKRQIGAYVDGDDRNSRTIIRMFNDQMMDDKDETWSMSE